MAHQFAITERQRLARLSSPADFSLGEARAIEPGRIINNSSLSLYCLDDERQQAVFVQLPAELDLTQAAFAYQAQFENAEQIITLSYDEFKQLAQQLKNPSKLILLYSTGRCGSTLLHRVFNELDEVVSLSEPDVLTQFIHLRKTDTPWTTERLELLRACVRFLFRPSHEKPVTHVLKFRNQCVEIMDLFDETYPEAIKLFLYRNALDWVRSLYRLFARNGPPSAVALDEVLERSGAYSNRDFSHYKTYFDENTKHISAVQMMTIWWLVIMERYEAFYLHSLPGSAFRYEDLSTQREATLERIFESCGLPTESVIKALSAFAYDSQRGTRLARANEAEGNQVALSADQIEQVRLLVANHPTITGVDYEASGTMLITR